MHLPDYLNYQAKSLISTIEIILGLIKKVKGSSVTIILANCVYKFLTRNPYKNPL